MKNRHVYLKMKTREEARKLVLSRFGTAAELESESVSTPDAVGRVLAEPVFAAVSSPGFHAAAMDGVAVRAEETFGASEIRPKTLVLYENAHPVNTGNRMPAGTDAVIMVEDLHTSGDGEARILSAAYPWQNVRKVGEDIVATEMLFPRNHLVKPACMAAMLTGGVTRVPVKKKPVIATIPTGDELKDWQRVHAEDLPQGKVLETNSWMLGKLAEEAGGVWRRHQIVPDDFFVLRQFVELAANGENQIVLVLAGSSAGSEDHTANVIANLGEVLVHGVTIMPGKPVIIGRVNNVPVIGIPGYPVSALVAFEEFVRPLICQMLKVPEPKRPTISAVSPRKIPSSLGVEELVRVKLGRVGQRVVATPLPRGAGSITTFTEADGIVRVGADQEGIRPDEPFEAELLRPEETIGNTLVAVGSHDNTLDLLADALRERYPRFTLSSAHVGSMSGIMAVKKGACHVAGVHLLDPADGTYNDSYVKKHIPAPTALVHLAVREQGLMVGKGNPKNIRGFSDLARPDITFINRQAGSGTRVLLDFRLRQEGIDPSAIQGYTNDEFTHMNVAVAVKSGAADAGLGILAAARALDLDFIPTATEDYELLTTKEFLDSPKMIALLNIINDPDFKKRIQTLGGYHTERTGDIRYLT